MSSQNALYPIVDSIRAQVELSVIRGVPNETIRNEVEIFCRYAFDLMTLLERQRILRYVDQILSGHTGGFPIEPRAFGEAS